MTSDTRKKPRRTPLRLPSERGHEHVDCGFQTSLSRMVERKTSSLVTVLGNLLQQPKETKTVGLAPTGKAGTTI